MEPITFDGCNVTHAKDQPEYLPMPGRRSLDGMITFCWKLRWAERLKLLVTGRIWHGVMTFNNPLQPQLLTLDSCVLDALDKTEKKP